VLKNKQTNNPELHEKRKLAVFRAKRKHSRYCRKSFPSPSVETENNLHLGNKDKDMKIFRKLFGKSQKPKESYQIGKHS
jgi:hypothetical protein